MGLVPFSYDLQGTTLVVSGYLDERSHFPDTLEIEAVNMQSISGFSSRGLKQFMGFLYGQTSPSILLQECPVCFVEAVNAISGLIKGSKITIESLMLPCRCENCSVEMEVLIRRAEIDFDRDDIRLQPQRCHRCREPLSVLVDPWEYFLFLYY